MMNPGGLSPQAEARKRQPSQEMPLPDLDDGSAVVRWRAAQHRSWGEEVALGEPAHDPSMIAGVPCLVAGPPDGLTVVYLHGGGFCLGSPGTAVPITARLARTFRVISVDYRLSPEHPCPGAIEDVVSVCSALAAEERFALAGDSAGANIAVTASLELVATGLVGPAALMLFSPHLDFRPMNAGNDSSELAAAYLGGRSSADPMVSPLARTDDELVSLPAVLVQTTDTEVMHDQALDLARRTPGPVALQVWRDLWHAWHYHRELPEAWDALDHAAQWLSSTMNELAPISEQAGGTVERDGW